MKACTIWYALPAMTARANNMKRNRTLPIILWFNKTKTYRINAILIMSSARDSKNSVSLFM